MRVLLAIDSSAASETVVHEAASRPWPFGTIFCVMTVVDMASLEGMPVLIEDAKHAAEKLVTSAAETLTTRVAATLSQSGYEVFSKVQPGVPETAIQDFAGEWPADLILIGTYGLSEVTGFFWGSVAREVIRTAPCSVEVVRRVPSHAGQGMRILLGTDGSEFSCKAAYSIANRPWPPESQVRILSVAEVLVGEGVAAASLPYSVYSERSLEDASTVARKHAEDAVHEARSILRFADLKISDSGPDVPIGDPRTALLDEAKSWDAQLIVLGSHGRRGFDPLLLGSVSESVAIRAHCSVEVVRR